MKWVSVKDRLPKKPMSLLVYAEDYTNYQEPIVASYVQTKEGFEFWDTDPFNDNSIQEYVTHWMPLPKNPIF